MTPKFLSRITPVATAVSADTPAWRSLFLKRGSMLSVPAKTPTDSNSPALPRPAHTVVRLCGDIDITSSPALRERLLVSLRSSTDLLVLDLSEASFHDPSGPAVLIGIQRRARPLGITVVLTSPGRRRPSCCTSRVWSAASRSVPHWATRSAPVTSPPPGSSRTPAGRTRRPGPRGGRRSRSRRRPGRHSPAVPSDRARSLPSRRVPPWPDSAGLRSHGGQSPVHAGPVALPAVPTEEQAWTRRCWLWNRSSGMCRYTSARTTRTTSPRPRPY